MTGKRGVYEKYRVERVDGKPIEWCFVLEIGDLLARQTLREYVRLSAIAGKGNLASDLEALLDEYEAEAGVEQT